MYSLKLNLNRLSAAYFPSSKAIVGSLIAGIVAQIFKDATVLAAGKTFTIQASRSTPGHSHLEATVTGSIKLYQTGYVELDYLIQENLYLGSSVLRGNSAPLQLTLTFYNHQGELIWSVTESHQNPGSHKKIFTVDKEILSQIHTMKTTLLFS